MRQARGLADEQVESGGVMFELLAVLMLPLRALALGLAVRIGRLGDLANVFCRMEKIDQLAICVLLEETPIARRAVGYS